MSKIISSQYWGSVDYFRFLLSLDTIEIEAHEHFVKASYRNRCHIASPDGMLTLSAPIKNGRGIRRVIKDVELFNEVKWQQNHWQTLCTAYRRSPFFEYFEDDLAIFYHKEYKYLLDFNMDLFQWIDDYFDLGLNAMKTTKYQSPSDDDFRSIFNPSQKKDKNPYKEKPTIYHQVFEDRCGFMPNLCILDMIFAEGPNTFEKLKLANSAI